MKKILFTFMTILMSASMVYTASAETASDGKALSDFTASPEYAEIISLEDEMLLWLEDACDYGELSIPANLAIDFTRAVKLYVGTDIFSLNTQAKNVILEALEQGPYMWIVPVWIQDTQIMLEIVKGMPLNPDAEPYLTEEQKEKIISQEGKWTVGGYTANWCPEYLTTIQNTLQTQRDCQDYVLVGGLPGLEKPVALFMDDKSAKKVLMLQSYNQSIMSQSNSISRTIDANLWTYSDTAKLVDQIKKGNMNLQEQVYGGYGANIIDMEAESTPPLVILWVSLSCTIGLGLLAALLFLVSKFRRKKGI